MLPAMSPPPQRAAWAVSFASVVNALSIPLIAFLLWWTLNRATAPDRYCPAIEEFKLTQLAALVALRCQPVLLAQLDIAKYAVIGLVGALSLSHLVSVAREAKASFDLKTAIGGISIGGDDKRAAMAQGAQQAAGAAQDEATDLALGKEPKGAEAKADEPPEPLEPLQNKPTFTKPPEGDL